MWANTFLFTLYASVLLGMAIFTFKLKSNLNIKSLKKFPLKYLTNYSLSQPKTFSRQHIAMVLQTISGIQFLNVLLLFLSVWLHTCL